MNILIVTQYFWPEPFVINDLVIKMRELGHEITIFTGKPNYPDGHIYENYQSKGIHEEPYQNGISIYRVPLRPRKTGNVRNLILNYLSFVWSGITHSIKFAKNKQFDSIIVFAPSPITSAIPGIFLKKLTKAHLSVWVQDLWPESLKATGFVKNRFIIGCTKVLVKMIYSFSDTLLLQSKAFIAPVLKLTPKKDVVYYPNSAKDNIYQSNKEITIPKELETILTDNFCVVFTGNIGTAQAMETVVSAARQLPHLPNFKIVLVGSGSQSDWVKQQITTYNLSNLVLAGRFPPFFMPYIFSKASALLVTLKNDEIFTYTVPCKIQSYLAAGKPIIAAIDGEGGRIIKEAKAGFVSPAENPNELAKNLEIIYKLPKNERDELGRSGRLYFLEQYEMNKQSEVLIEILKARINTSSK